MYISHSAASRPTRMLMSIRKSRQLCCIFVYDIFCAKIAFYQESICYHESTMHTRDSAAASSMQLLWCHRHNRQLPEACRAFRS